MLPATYTHERPEPPHGDPRDALPRPTPPRGMAAIFPLGPTASPEASLLRDVVAAAEADGCRPAEAKVERQGNQIAVAIAFGVPWRPAASQGASALERVGDIARRHGAAVTSASSSGDGLVTVAFLVAAARR
ncbi:MAG: hypothetical protein ACJ79R_16805 [Anaeromyxobacteraceae bacterium]